MAFPKCLALGGKADVGVDFCDGQGAVAEEGLDVSNVCAIFEEEGCYGVAEHVWSYFAANARKDCVFID